MIKLACLEFHIKQGVNDVLLESEIVYGHLCVYATMSLRQILCTSNSCLKGEDVYCGDDQDCQEARGKSRLVITFQPCSPSPCVHMLTFCQAPALLLQALLQKSLAYTSWMSPYLPASQSRVLSAFQVQ